MEYDSDSSQPDDEEELPYWLQLLREKAKAYDFGEAISSLCASGELPSWENDGSNVIGDLVSFDLFDAVEAIFEAKPFSHEHLRVNGDWFAGADPGGPSRLLELLRLMRAKLLCTSASQVLHLSFTEVFWGEQEALYWIECMPEATCQLVLEYSSCDFGAQHDGMLEAALLAPLTKSFTLQVMVEQRPLSRRFCKLLGEHSSLACLCLPSISATSSEALAAGLLGNRTLLNLVVSVEDHGFHDPILHALRGHPVLEELELGRLVAQDVHALEVLPSMPAFKVLTIGGLGDAAVVPKSAFTALENLMILTPEPALTDETGRSVLKALCKSAGLKWLRWQHPRIGLAHKELAAKWMRGAGRLRVLELIEPAGDTGQMVLDCMAFNTSIELFILESCNVAPDSSLSLKGVIKHPMLNHLSLLHCSLKKSTCIQIAQLISEPSVLEQMSIMGCDIEPAGVSHLCSALNGASNLLGLEIENSLDASQCCSVFKALRHNRSLQILHLCPGEVSPESMDDEIVDSCLDDQFALLVFKDRTSSLFDPQALALLQTLLERNSQAAAAEKLDRWRVAVEVFVHKIPTAEAMPTDIAQPLWNSFVQTVRDYRGQERQVLRSRGAWEALKALELIGRLPD